MRDRRYKRNERQEIKRRDKRQEIKRRDEGQKIKVGMRDMR